jgi:shikimate dehydrogenase
MPASGDAADARVSGATATAGVIGWPVDHSLSPAIHNAAYAALGMDWVYVPLPVPPGRVADALRGLAALGFRGANVTMPHKTEVAELVDERSEDAAALRAVNTVVVTPEGLLGHNTDAPGFARFLRDDAGFEPAGRTALLLGGGGAARACALALARDGLARVTVAVRTPSQGDAITELLDPFEAAVERVPLERAPDHPADLVVNATPLGRAGEVPPHPAFGPGLVAVDLLYRPAVTPFQLAAREAGAEAHGGLGLLLHQAALSFELWSGRVPPLDVMSAAAVRSLTEDAAAPGT